MMLVFCPHLKQDKYTLERYYICIINGLKSAPFLNSEKDRDREKIETVTLVVYWRLSKISLDFYANLKMHLKLWV